MLEFKCFRVYGLKAWDELLSCEGFTCVRG